MPRTPEDFDRIRERSRERILNAALELFARKGFESTSVRMLADSAGISQGLLYNYFEGKHDLLRAIFERGYAQVGETLEEAEGADPADALAVLVRAAFAAVERNRDFWKLSYQIRMRGDVLADVGPEIVSSARRIRERIQTLVERAGVEHPAERAHLLFAAIDGVAQHYVLDPEHYPIEAVADEIVRSLVPRPGTKEEP